MATAYATPGVYVEIQKGSPPIEPVGTSTAAFIGEVPDGAPMPDKPDGTGKYPVPPAGQPELLTSFDQFLTRFGNVMPYPTAATQKSNSALAHAVYGYFNNGGSRCWVARLPDLKAGDVTARIIVILKKFEAIDEISTVAALELRDPAGQKEVVAHCDRMKYRFALLDGQLTADRTPDAIKGGVDKSNYAALYHPRIKVSNLELNANLPEDQRKVLISPLGHVAGVIARVDKATGPHYPPANEVVRGVLALEHDFTAADQEGVNPPGINLIRNLRGSIKIWGARTLGGKDNGEFKYVSVQRTMSMIAQSIDEGTQFAVFQPNSQPLWERIRRSVRGFLTTVWRDGALFGATEDQAFYVKCDEGTNPPEVRLLGRVVVEIGVAIVQPAEFVIFRISQLAQATP